MKRNNEEIKKLADENKRLKAQLEAIVQKEKDRQKRKLKIARKGAELWVGGSLKDSFYKLYDELPNLSKETFAEFSANVLKRFTRIGLIGMGLALLPTLFLIIQTIIFSNQTKVLKDQTKKIEIQNNKIEKQVYLEEASRRNNLVLLMDNILSQVNLEISDSNKKLSTPLIGRISALSQGFQPYYFLEDSTNLTIKKYSPERGQLLLALANSGIDTGTMDVIYKKATFSSAYLKGAVLDSLYLKGANLKKADLQRANLVGANLNGADLSGANFKRAILIETNLFKVDLNAADLSGTDLVGANLVGANLMGANLQRANLQRAILREANFIGADLQKVNLIDTDLYKADLQRAILREANLIGADLQRANLIGTDLIGVDLQRTVLIGTDLYKADLQRAILREANLQKANLQKANLQGAYLIGTNLQKVNLLGADLTGLKVLLFDWIDQLKVQNVEGYEEIKEKYIVKDSRERTDDNEIVYTLEPKENKE